LKEALESVKQTGYGVVSPILVRENNGYYEVVSGYKRFYVAKKLHLKEIPVTVREIPDELLIYMILSRGNKKQHDNILNKTYSYRILISEYHVSRKDIATVSKSSVSQVANILRLENLDEEVKIALKKEKINYGQARVLLGLETQRQIEFLNKMIEKKESVRDIEQVVKRYRDPSELDEEILSLEKNNKCKVTHTNKNITFKFDTKGELERFIKKMNTK